ncbi:cellulose synthase [Aquamicrobium terrae]
MDDVSGRIGSGAVQLLAHYIPPTDQASALAAVPTPQTGNAGSGSAAQPGSSESQPPTAGQVVDETALRYFAQKGDVQRLETEIARLRALYPDWTPPANPLAIPAIGDPQTESMWKLYSKGKLAQLRKAIADRRIVDPTWQAPADLLDRLGIAEARERLVNSSSLKQYETVIRVAADFPSLLTCSDVDVLWRVAEAFAASQKPDRAKDAYLYILHNCEKPAERLATVEKAIPLLSRNAINDLLATERIGPDGIGEFAKARADLERYSVGAAGKDPAVIIDPGDLSELEAIARRDGLASDNMLLGWYHLNHGDPGKAAYLFAAAGAKDDTAEAAQGQALALIALKRPAEAEALLYKWQNGSDGIRKVYLAAVADMLSIEPRPELTPQVLQRVVPVVAAARDAVAAQQLGWYARALDQHETARKWFAAALDWKADDEASAYGLALSDWQLGDRAGVIRLQRLWAARSERIAMLGKTTKSPGRNEVTAAGETAAPASSSLTGQVPAIAQANRQGTRYPPADDSGFAARGATHPRRKSCASAENASSVNAEAALAHGWCLMELDRPAEAAAIFGAALASQDRRVRRDAAWGQSLAYLRSGLANEAAVAATKAPQPRERAIELEAGILAQRATSFFEARRYAETLLALDRRSAIAAERRDLMALRGYAYLGLYRLDDARKIFRTLSDAGDREGARGLAAVEAARR